MSLILIRMKNEKVIEVLNEIITINNDRIEGYETAFKETEETDLRALFSQFIATSKKCRQELATEVNNLGGKAAEGTLTSGKFFRVWMDVKAALTGKDRKAILNSCDYGEGEAKDTYDRVLESESEHISIALRTMIVAQKSLLRADHNRVKVLRDTLANA